MIDCKIELIPVIMSLTTICRNMMNLNTLLDLPEFAVFAIVNHTDKRVYLSYSSSLLVKLSEVLGYIRRSESYGKQMGEDIGKLEFVIVETVDCRNRLKIRHSYHYDQFQKNGYSFYNPSHPVRYKPKQLILRMADHNEIPRIALYLVSKGNHKILVGVFETVQKANEFQQIHYPSEFANDIIIARNELSMRYINENGGDAEE